MPTGSAEPAFPGANPDKNWLNGAVYDANGNTLGLNGLGFLYDTENRMSAFATGSFYENYVYDESNHRVERTNNAGGVNADLVYFYGPGGELLATFEITLIGAPSASYTATVKSERVFFGGMLLGQAGPDYSHDVSTLTDRLGTAVPGYPYGTDVGTAAGADQPDFATYTKEGASGLEYANQRYYSAGYGRFMTVDPDGGSGNVEDPGSLNLYAYADGDPANDADPSGFCSVFISGITQGPGIANTAGQDQIAKLIGAENVYPYAGGTITSGFNQVLEQGTRETQATAVAASAFLAAANDSPGPIDVFAFSGGAEAFSAAFKLLPSSIQKRIENVVYLSPGFAPQTVPVMGYATTAVAYDPLSVIDTIVVDPTKILALALSGAGVTTLSDGYNENDDIAALYGPLQRASTHKCLHPRVFLPRNVNGAGGPMVSRAPGVDRDPIYVPDPRIPQYEEN